MVRQNFKAFFWPVFWTRHRPILPETTDLRAPIFRNTETNTTWSLNDLWHQFQEAADAFAGVEKGQAPVIKTACFPYPRNVTVDMRKIDSTDNRNL
jgi:hypothetical protein